MTTTTLAPDHVERFEAIYSEARGDSSLIPWADDRPNPALVNWLNAAAPSLVRCGARVAVVGCGLGHDAVELVHRGYDVTAFDCSPTAVAWARSHHAQLAACFHEADLFDIPAKWRHRFDLVVEINTIQSLPPDLRVETARGVADMLSPHGHLLVICHHADAPPSAEDGPPWPLTLGELVEAMDRADLVPDGEVSVFEDDETPPVTRMRGLFRRVASA